MNIQEDYVSFEIAKLLKEKGFDAVKCQNSPHFAYNIDGQFSGPSWDTIYIAPTLQMAMKWLREVHNIHIYTVDTVIGFKYVIQDMFHRDEDIHPIDGICFSSNEQACEAAIKHCLENLI